MPTYTSMPMLSHSELDSMLSLNDSELEELLTQIPAEQARRVMGQLRARSSMDRRIPMAPTARQADFLGVTAKEALYGGAAGGGKSEALLLWLAEGVQISTYSGIIFRRTFQQLSKSNDSLIAKSYRIYPSLGGKWNDTKKQWRFPSGAMIEMGALEHETSVLNYQGPAYHRIAFDELTQFTQGQYEYLVNSRIRSVKGFPIYLGARGASNPGGPGHFWVLQRFITPEAMDYLDAMDAEAASPAGLSFETPDGKQFVPARIADNPFLDIDEYREQLSGFTDPVMRERLMNGNWRVLPDGLIKPQWIRYYRTGGQIITLLDADGESVVSFDERECRRFVTIDPAGTSEQKAKEQRGKAPSWSVMQVWDVPPSKFGQKLLLRHCVRKRVDFPGLLSEIRDIYSTWRPSRILIENEKYGQAACDSLKRELPIYTTATGGKDKATRAAKLLVMMERGEVFLPRYDTGWKHALEAEWFSWQGLDEETCDQVDAAAYAAIEVGGGTSRVVKLMTDPRVSKIPAFNSMD